MSGWGAVAQVGAQVGSQIIGTLVNQAFAKRNAEMSLKYGKKASDYTYAQDMDMWNRMNEYNLPINQMQRLQEAGLNPAMMYGTGQGANVSKEMPKYNNPNVRYEAPVVNPLEILSAYQSYKVAQAQVDNIKEQTETRRLENSLTKSLFDKKIELFLANTRSAEAKAAIEQIRSMVEREFSQGKPLEAEQGYLGGTRKRLAELEISQHAARRTRAEADVKDVEAGLFRKIESIVGPGENAQALAKLLQMWLIRR